MKRLVTLVFPVLSFISLWAQNPSLSREVIAAGGDFFLSSVGSISWTLGEPVTETFGNTSVSIVLTQGFQQPDELAYTTIGGLEVNSGKISVSLYPNPAAYVVHLDIKYDDNTQMKIELIDMLGRVLNSKNLEVIKDQTSNYQLDVSNLSAGMYMFKLTNNGLLLNGYKFQKV